jgi:hypothetical protein
VTREHRNGNTLFVDTAVAHVRNDGDPMASLGDDGDHHVMGQSEPVLTVDEGSGAYEPTESLHEPSGSVPSGGYVSPAGSDGLGSLGDLVSSESDASGDRISDDGL